MAAAPMAQEAEAAQKQFVQLRREHEVLQNSRRSQASALQRLHAWAACVQQLHACCDTATSLLSRERPCIMALCLLC